MRDPITTLSMMERILIVALTSSVREGFIPFRGYRTWYRLIGDFTPTAEGTFPLLTLHGGPGIPHDSLEPLEELAENGCPIIFYDQLGCGNSDCPDDPSLWKVNLFLGKITAVRHHLALDQIHLFGHSWGGALALHLSSYLI